MDTKWIVGGDDVLHMWHVVRKAPYGGSAYEWVMQGTRVKYFSAREVAQRYADKLNR